jgi:hypothetical protein
MPTVFLPDPVAVTLDAHTCGKCGIVFGMPSDYAARRANDHETFYCPNGHPRAFIGKTEAEKLRDQLAAKDREIAAAKSRAETERTWRVDAEKETAKVTRSLRATKAVVTRTKKKIVAGRCPCCTTKFKDLAVHMRTEHPNYDPDKAVAALEAKER